MRPLIGCLSLMLSMSVAGIAQGQAYYQESAQTHKDIQIKVDDLLQAKAGWEKAQADWNAAQKENQKLLTMEERNAVQKRIAKDASDIQTYLYQMMGDVYFLKSQWTYLTEKEKELVASIEKTII